MYTICVNFLKELKEATKRFAEFAYSHKGVILLLVIELILLYGQRLFYYDISIDSEIAISSQKAMLESWIGIDRFGLVLTKFIFSLTRFVPETSNVLMVISLGCSALLFDFCIWEWSGKKGSYRLFYYIFPAAYISAPCLAEQFYFSLQSFEIAWAGLLCIATVYCIGRYIIFKGNLLWSIFGIVLMIWSFGSYQAFVSLFISGVLILFVVCYNNKSVEFQKGKEWFFGGVKCVAIFLVGFVLYKLIAKLAQIYCHVDSSYVDNMFGWKTVGIQVALNNIKGDASRIYLAGWDVFFSKCFLPIALVSIVLLIFRGWRMHRKGYLVYLLALALLAVSPLFLTIISGSYQPIRGQLVYPFVYAFFLAQLVTLQKRQFATVCCVIVTFLSLYQGQTMTQLFHTAHMTYVQDQEVATLIYNDIEKTGIDTGLDIYPVVFVGKKSADLPNDALLGDVIGHSFFEWDSSSFAGSTNRIIGFCATLGYDNMAAPTEQQVKKAKKIARDMPVWPGTGSVKQENGIIVIKLSEETD